MPVFFCVSDSDLRKNLRHGAILYIKFSLSEVVFPSFKNPVETIAVYVLGL